MRVGIVRDQFGNLTRGGAEVQVDNTVKYLKQIAGINIEFVDYTSKNIEEYDIVHFFKSQYEYAGLASTLKDKKIPYVVSSIYFPTNYRKSVIAFKAAKMLPSFLQNAILYSTLFKLWDNAAYIFPNTDEEAGFIKKVGASAPIEIIPNGLDLDEMKDVDAQLFLSKFPALSNLNFVLNVARIDRRKNQKALVQACMKLDVPVAIIGKIWDEEYFQEILGLKYNKLFYLGPIYDRDLLFSAYSACSVFCLPSTMETPGIAAMEAAYYNKPIAITKFGGTRYYFKDKAYYVDWRNVNDIANGISLCFNKPPQNLRQHIEQFTWDKIANHYHTLYNKILGIQ